MDGGELSEFLRKRMNRREALSTAGKVAIGVIVAGVAAGLGGYYGAQMMAPKPTKRYFFALSSIAANDPWLAIYMDSFRWYCEDMGFAYTVTAPLSYSAEEQISQCKRMIDAGIDGLIVSAVDMKACREIADYAYENKVPLFTTNSDIDSPYPKVLMYVGYSGVKGSATLGELTLEYLKKKYGEPRGVVLNIMGDPKCSEGVFRSMGFHSVLDKYPNIQVIDEIGGWTREGAMKIIQQLIPKEKIDVIYTANGNMGMGVIEALKLLGEDPKKYYILTIDAFPDVLDEIRKGTIAAAFDQTPTFYNRIAMEYMIRYIKEGEKALPKKGQTITGDMLKLSTGKKHYGVDPWAKPIWAPAIITDVHDEFPDLFEYSHPWFQTQGVLVTKENADDPALWGNIPIPGWKK